MTEEEIYEAEQEFAEESPKSNYFIMITYDVMTDSRLSHFQKLLFGAITGLCHEKGYCYARNEYFEKLFDVKTATISNGIGKLVELGYVVRKIVYKKEYDMEKDKWITTKEIAGRQLYPITDPIIRDQIAQEIKDKKEGILKNYNRGILKNYNRGYSKNLESIINNNSIINNTTFTKVNGEANTSPLLGEDKNNNIINNNEVLGVDLVSENNSQETAPPQAAKRGGLGPLIDIINKRFNKEAFPEINNLLVVYIKSYLGRRKLPDEEKWNNMLDDLITYSTIRLPGTEGGKFMYKTAMQIIEKAITGKDGAPFTEFDNPNIQKEPEFNLNQDFKRY